MKKAFPLVASLILSVGIFQSNICYSQEQSTPSEKVVDKDLQNIIKAANNGDAYAQSNLGLIYKKGKGVTQDYNEAVKWFRKSAEQGNAFAQSNLGLMYKKGQGVAQDYQEAFNWIKKSADQGNAFAQSSLVSTAI